MNDDRLGAAAVGFVLGVIAMMVLGAMGVVGNANKVLAECEAELPRNQHCVLTARPE